MATEHYVFKLFDAQTGKIKFVQVDYNGAWFVSEGTGEMLPACRISLGKKGPINSINDFKKEFHPGTELKAIGIDLSKGSEIVLKKPMGPLKLDFKELGWILAVYVLAFGSPSATRP